MSFMLDTNICIYMIKNRPDTILKHLVAKRPHEVGISSITLAELQHGVEKSAKVEKNRLALEMLTSSLQVLPFDSFAAERYGMIRAQLERRGKLIGPMDLLIAAHAASINWTLVTNNMKEFKRVPDLNLENWTA